MAGVLNNLHSFRFQCDGEAGPFDFTCTRGWLVMDCMASTAASAVGATGRLQRAAAASPVLFNNVSSELGLETANQIVYTTSITVGQETFEAGDVMRVTVADAPTAEVIVDVLPRSWVEG
jgi:hypothetical protein